MNDQMSIASARMRTIEELPNQPRIVTIGTFDGVHRGHQALIVATSERARARSVSIAAVTFEPIPAFVLRPDVFPGRVCTVEDKFACLAQLPLDEIIPIRFDLELARQTPEAFMAYLSERTGMIELWVGEAFALGKNRVGDVVRLTEIGKDLGFGVTAVPRLTENGEIISSSEIRRAIEQGDVARAGRFLGRSFRIRGEVIHGAHLGRTIGYPTANVVPPRDLVALADGIYATTTLLPAESKPRPSMTYIGTRPTVNSGERLIETHLLDFAGDLYDQVIQVEFIEHLRGDATFAGVEALVAQLRDDEVATRAVLGLSPAESGD